MRKHRIATIVAALAASTLLGATALDAQARGRADEVPRGYEPPRGMCRVWLTGVPAAQQPAPTDCATAIRRRPENARVVFGEPAPDGRDARREAIRDAVRGEASRLAPAPRRGAAERDPRPARERPERPERTEPAERTRAEPPAARPAPRAEEPRPRARGTRPPASDADLLADARALDLELLEALYGDPPGARDPDLPRVADGRAAPGQRAGERGRGRSGDPYDDGYGGGYVAPSERMLDWAVGLDGRPLSAWEVERLLLGPGLLGQGGGPLVLGALPNDGRLDARPGECFDRNFDGRCDDLSGAADGCFDANRDGRCDDARYDGSGGYGSGYGSGYGAARPGGGSVGLCFDRDRDGRCDEPWSDGRRIPQTLPEMAAAVGLRRGVASYDVERWLRRTDLEARLTDRDGDGLPERVTWLDPAGRVAQVWVDRDGDGIADRVELFRDGLPVQVIGR